MKKLNRERSLLLMRLKKIALSFAFITAFFAPNITSFAQEKELAQHNQFEIDCFFAIIVTDIYASINWYTEVLQFDTLNYQEVGRIGLKQANLRRKNTYIELIELETSLDPSQEIPGINEKSKLLGLFKVGFAIHEFDAYLDHIDTTAKLETRKSVVTDPNSNKKMVIVRDPDGNRIQIFQK